MTTRLRFLLLLGIGLVAVWSEVLHAQPRFRWPVGPIEDWRVGPIEYWHDRLPMMRRLDLDIDTDRNGCVDDALDERGEEMFDAARGAIVFANLDLDCVLETGVGNCKESRVCPCADADDELVNGWYDELDLAPLVIRLKGQIGFHGTQYFLRISEKSAARWMRVYWNGMQVLGPTAGVTKGDHRLWEIPAESLRTEILVHVEARSFPTREFPGTLIVEAVERTSLFWDEPQDRVVDTVQLRVAPFMMNHQLQPTRQIFANNRVEVPYAALERAVIANGVSSVTKPVYDGIFPQDMQELGAAVAPPSRCFAGHGQRVMSVALQNAFADAQVVKPGPDVAVLRFSHGGGDVSLSAGGNLEVTPPAAGAPLGRIYYGAAGTRTIPTELREFLEAQNIQEPIEIDTTWLFVSHVDEMIAFIPNPWAWISDEKPFKVLMAGPGRAIDALLSPACAGTPDLTALLAFRTMNEAWQTRVDNAKDRLRVELGLQPSDFIDVPVLFRDRDGRASALTPNMVNLLVVNGHLVIPEPGVSCFDSAIKSELRAIGYSEKTGAYGFSFIDTTKLAEGEIHCATNALREPLPWP